MGKVFVGLWRTVGGSTVGRGVELGRNGRGALYEGHVRLFHVEIPDWKECSRQRRMWLMIQVRKAHAFTRKTSSSSFIKNVLQLLQVFSDV